MSKLLSDIAVVVRCKPLAAGPNGISVPVTGGGSTGGLSTVRATNPKQVNAQKLCAGDIVVSADASRFALLLDDSSSLVGKCVNDKGFIIIRLASDAEIDIYMTYIQHVLDEADNKGNFREVYNNISGGQMAVPDTSQDKVRDIFNRLIAMREVKETAKRKLDEAIEAEAKAWRELLA